MTRAAADTYRSLVADLGKEALREAVDRQLDQLDLDPADPSVSRRTFDSPVWGRRLRVAVARGPDEDWLIVWVPKDDGTPKVVYLGPDRLD